MFESESDYQIALTEAAWFTAHPPQNSNDQDYVNHLIKKLVEYEDVHGLESHELRELKAAEDSK